MENEQAAVKQVVDQNLENILFSQKVNRVVALSNAVSAIAAFASLAVQRGDLHNSLVEQVPAYARRITYALVKASEALVK